MLKSCILTSLTYFWPEGFFFDKTTNSTSLFTFIVDFFFVNPIQTRFFVCFLEPGGGRGGGGAPGVSIKDTCKIII